MKVLMQKGNLTTKRIKLFVTKKLLLMCSILYVCIHINLCIEVEEHYIRAIEIYEMSLGASDMNVIKTKNNLVRFTCRPSAECMAWFVI